MLQISHCGALTAHALLQVRLVAAAARGQVGHEEAAAGVVAGNEQGVWLGE